MVDYHDVMEEIIIPEEKLQARVKELGAAISRDYAGQDLLLLCILRGAVVFLTDLMRSLTLSPAIDFMAVSSYGVGARASSGQVRILFDVNQSLEGRHVLVVEDIVDSGHTLAAVLDLLAARHPASLKVCALLDKSAAREVDIPIHYIGFDVPNQYLFGYGLDIDELFRNLPFIAAAQPNVFLKPAENLTSG